jgi:hypothetical protein
MCSIRGVDFSLLIHSVHRDGGEGKSEFLFKPVVALGDTEGGMEKLGCRGIVGEENTMFGSTVCKGLPSEVPPWSKSLTGFCEAWDAI